jgi:hypothetical protein
MANVRKQKNHIHSLQLENHLATSQQHKHLAIYEHLLQHIGT